MSLLLVCCVDDFFAFLQLTVAQADYAGHLTKWMRVRCKKNKIYEVNSRLTVRKTRKNTVETALQSSHLIDKFIENFKID